jgi:hypothetical protein
MKEEVSLPQPIYKREMKVLDRRTFFSVTYDWFPQKLRSRWRASRYVPAINNNYYVRGRYPLSTSRIETRSLDTLKRNMTAMYRPKTTPRHTFQNICLHTKQISRQLRCLVSDHFPLKDFVPYCMIFMNVCILITAEVVWWSNCFSGILSFMR